MRIRETGRHIHELKVEPPLTMLSSEHPFGTEQSEKHQVWDTVTNKRQHLFLKRI